MDRTTPRLIDRSDLVAALDRAAASKVTIISAPAGSGKTPALHRLAAGWFAQHGQVVDAIRHTQAAGDWPGAGRLLADHSFSRTLDGQTQTIEAPAAVGTARPSRNSPQPSACSRSWQARTPWRAR